MATILKEVVPVALQSTVELSENQMGVQHEEHDADVDDNKQLRRIRAYELVEANNIVLQEKVSIGDDDTLNVYRTLYYRSKHNDLSIVVKKDTNETNDNFQMKLKCITTAINKVEKDGYELPENLRFWLCSQDAVQTNIFPFDDDGYPMAEIVLGPSVLTDGIVNEVNRRDKTFRSKKIKGDQMRVFDATTKIIIYLIGHILHAHNVGFLDWYQHTASGEHEEGYTTRALYGKKWLDEKTLNGSRYHDVFAAGKDFLDLSIGKKFVAEVFLGLAIGRRYSNEIMMSYREMKGPCLNSQLKRSWAANMYLFIWPAKTRGSTKEERGMTEETTASSQARSLVTAGAEGTGQRPGEPSSEGKLIATVDNESEKSNTKDAQESLISEESSEIKAQSASQLKVKVEREEPAEESEEEIAIDEFPVDNESTEKPQTTKYEGYEATADESSDMLERMVEEDDPLLLLRRQESERIFQRQESEGLLPLVAVTDRLETPPPPQREGIKRSEEQEAFCIDHTESPSQTSTVTKNTRISDIQRKRNEKRRIELQYSSASRLSRKKDVDITERPPFTDDIILQSSVSC